MLYCNTKHSDILWGLAMFIVACFLHSQTRNFLSEHLNAIIAIFVTFAQSWCFSIEAGFIAANHLMPVKQAKKSFYQALWYKSFRLMSYKEVPPYCNWKSISSMWWEKSGVSILWMCPINLASFLFSFICNARYLDHQFCLF